MLQVIPIVFDEQDGGIKVDTEEEGVEDEGIVIDELTCVVESDTFVGDIG